MAGFKRMMSYLGLVDDDEYDDYEPYEEQPPSPARPPAARPVASGFEGEPSNNTLRTLAPQAPAEQSSGVTVQRSSVVRPIIPVASAKPQTVTPKSFGDAQEIADRLKGGVPVIVNLQAADRDLMRRIVDFSAGLTYGIGADMERTADRVYLLSPVTRS